MLEAWGLRKLTLSKEWSATVFCSRIILPLWVKIMRQLIFCKPSPGKISRIWTGYQWWCAANVFSNFQALEIQAAVACGTGKELSEKLASYRFDSGWRTFCKATEFLVRMLSAGDVGDVSRYFRAISIVPYNWVSLGNEVAILASPDSMQSEKTTVGGLFSSDKYILRDSQPPIGAGWWWYRAGTIIWRVKN